MITIDEFSPSGVAQQLIDFGFMQESVGGTLTRIDRPGNRWEIEVSFPALPAATAKVLQRRLVRAKTEGLRMNYPLLGQSQGSPGTPVVDGATSAGRVLKLRGMTVGYVVAEGYWLSLTDSGGTRYLHQVAAQVTVDGAGKATLTVDPPMRIIPADGNSVNLTAPQIEGLVTSQVARAIDADQLTRGMGFTLREAV